MIDPFTAVAFSLITALVPTGPAPSVHAKACTTESQYMDKNPSAVVLDKIDIHDKTFGLVVENLLENMKKPPQFAFDAILVLGPKDGSEPNRVLVFSMKECVIAQVGVTPMGVKALLGEQI